MCRITPLLLVITIAAAGAAQRRGSAELERAGWEAIRAGRLQEAADTFREATRLEPRSARLMLGTGLVAHLLGRTEEARQHLAGALQIQPSLTEASLLLGQLLYRAGDVDGAIQVYEQALAHAPDEPVLVNKLDAWRRETELHGKFTQRLT